MPVEYSFSSTKGEARVVINNREYSVFASNPLKDMRSPSFHVKLKRDHEGKDIKYLRFYAFGGIQRLIYHGGKLKKRWVTTIWDEGRIGEILFYPDEEGNEKPIEKYPIVLGGTGRFARNQNDAEPRLDQLSWSKVIRVADGNPGYNDYRIHLPEDHHEHKKFIKEVQRCGFDTVISAGYKGHLKWHRINIWVSSIEVPPKAKSFKIIVSPMYSNESKVSTKTKEGTVTKVSIGIAKIEGLTKEEMSPWLESQDYTELVINGEWDNQTQIIENRILMSVNNYLHMVFEAKRLEQQQNVLDPSIIETQIKLWASAASNFNHNIRDSDEIILKSSGNTDWKTLDKKFNDIINNALNLAQSTTAATDPHAHIPFYHEIQEIQDYASYLSVKNATKIVDYADIAIRKYCYRSIQATLSAQIHQNFLELDSRPEFKDHSMLSPSSIRLFLIQAIHMLNENVKEKIITHAEKEGDKLILDSKMVEDELQFPVFSLYYLERTIDPTNDNLTLHNTLEGIPETRNMIFTLPADLLDFYARIFLWYAQSLYSLENGGMHKYYFYLISSIFYALKENFTLSKRFLSEIINSSFLTDMTPVINQNLPLIALELEYYQFRNDILSFLESPTHSKLMMFDELLYWNKTFENQLQWVLQHDTIRELARFGLTVSDLSYAQIMLNNVIFPILLNLNTDLGNQIIYSFLHSLFLLFNSQEHVDSLSTRFLRLNPNELFTTKGLHTQKEKASMLESEVIYEIFIRLYRINIEIIQAYSMIFLGQFNEVVAFINQLHRKVTGLLQFTLGQNDQNINRLMNDFLLIEKYITGLKEYVIAFLYNKQVSYHESLDHLNASIEFFEKVVLEGFPHVQLNPLTVHANIILWLLRIYRDSIKTVITEEEQYASIVKKNIDYLYLRSTDETIQPLIPKRVSFLINKLHGYLASWVGARQISNIIELINESASTLVFPFTAITSSNLIKSRINVNVKYSWLKVFSHSSPWTMNHLMSATTIKLQIDPDWETTSNYDMIDLKIRAYTIEDGKIKYLNEKSLTNGIRIHKEDYPKNAQWHVRTKLREDFTGQCTLEVVAEFSNSVNKDLKFKNPPYHIGRLTKLNTKPIADKLLHKYTKYILSVILSTFFSFVSFSYIKERSLAYFNQLHLAENLSGVILGVIVLFMIFFVLTIIVFNFIISRNKQIKIKLDDDVVAFEITKSPFLRTT